MSKNFFSFENRSVYEIMCENMVIAGQATDNNTILRMRFACWITKVTDIQSVYSLLFLGSNGYANAS